MLWGISRDLWSLMSTIGCILYFYSLFKCKKILWADFITYNSNNQTFSGLFTFDQTFGWYLCVAQLQLSLIYAVSVLWVIIIFLTKFFSFSREKQDSSQEKKRCVLWETRQEVVTTTPYVVSSPIMPHLSPFSIT